MSSECPSSYRQFLLRFNGGRPTPSYFWLGSVGDGAWFRIHFFFGIDDDVECCDLLWNHATFKHRLPSRVIPVASDEFGNLFCFDLRTSEHAPVLFWDHEKEGQGEAAALRIKVADSFEDWIDQLTVRGD